LKKAATQKFGSWHEISLSPISLHIEQTKALNSFLDKIAKGAQLFQSKVFIDIESVSVLRFKP